jgi:uncharacterized protein YukE
VPELSGRELLREWENVTSAVLDTAKSLAGTQDLPRRVLEPLQSQLALVQEAIERERRLQKEITGLLVAPVDAVFDLLDQSAATLHRQADAMSAAGRALEDAGALIKAEAELFERTLGTLRRPAEAAKAIAGVDRQPRKKARARKPRR